MDYQPGNPQNGPGNGYNPYNNPYNNNNPYSSNPYGMPMQQLPVRHKGEGMATTAMALGIISLVSLLFLQVSIPLFLGSVSIVLAILSRGNLKKLLGKAKVGIICSIAALGLDAAFCVLSLWLFFVLPSQSPEFREKLSKICEQQYDISYDELIEELGNMWNGGTWDEDFWEKIGY